MIDLSIIIPIYNVEKYLKRCINSLLSQNLDNYEIILIDDESKDLSGEIADEYAKKYEFIKVIHQKNKGLAGARNTGLNIASGEYILFVDSDDWLIENTINKLLSEAKLYDLDIGVADFRYVDEDNLIEPNKGKPYECKTIISGEEYLTKCLEIKLPMMVWKSIYKHKFIVNNQLFFLEGFNHEDEHWMPLCYLKAKRVKNIDIVFYNYFIHTDCISKRPSDFEKNSLDLINICYLLKDKSFFINNIYLKQLFQNNIINLYLSAFYKGKLINKKYRKYINSDFFNNLYKNKYNSIRIVFFNISHLLYYYVNYVYKWIRNYKRR
ncbi:glycosyltransferase [Thomasclavelia cocleata]|uniref:glycosyltransferase n=2 Tax=Thomasclavelia cocleata TaxID=69824 RepID=UPI00272B73E5|nr:glycosyltransferase [Thomasclavelia cocleata]